MFFTKLPSGFFNVVYVVDAVVIMYPLDENLKT